MPLCVCACVSARVYACLGVFFTYLNWCVCTQGECTCQCVFFLSVPSPLLAQVLSGELQQSCGSTDRCMGGWGFISLSVSAFPLLLTNLSPPLRYYCTVTYLHKETSKYCGCCFLGGWSDIFNSGWAKLLSTDGCFWINLNKKMLLCDLSSKYFLCKPSSVVRLSKSGSIILVITTFILCSWRISGLVHCPILICGFTAWKQTWFCIAFSINTP